MSRPNDADIMAEAKLQELQEYLDKGLLTKEEVKRLSYLEMQARQNKFVQDQLNKVVES